jgi:hypothetical protein
MNWRYELAIANRDALGIVSVSRSVQWDYFNTRQNTVEIDFGTTRRADSEEKPPPRIGGWIPSALLE